MKRYLLPIFAFILLVSGFVSTLQAQNPWKKVTITVLDNQTQHPIDGAEIMFKSLIAKTVKKTNSEGIAVFDMLMITDKLNMNYAVKLPPGTKSYKPYSGSIALEMGRDSYEYSALLQSNNKTVSFKISDDKRQAIANATVKLNDESGLTAESNSDANGVANFEFAPDVQFKNPTLTVAKQGFADYAVPVEINNQTSQVSVVAPLATNTIMAEEIKEPARPKTELLGPTDNGNSSSLPLGYSVAPRNPVPLWGPYFPNCEGNPLDAVPSYTPLAVEDEQTLFDNLSKSCLGSLTDAVDALVDLTENVARVSTKFDAIWEQSFQAKNMKQLDQVPGAVDKTTADLKKLVEDEKANTSKAISEAVSKTTEMIEKMKELAAGPEMFAVSCLWSGFKDYAIPEPLLKMKSATQAFGKAQTAMLTKLEAIKTRVNSGESLKYSDKELFTNWKDVNENIEKTNSGLNLIYSYVKNPSQILPYETQVNLAISKAESLLSTMMTDCQIREADRQIKQGISAGQALLLATRKRAAQMKKGESKWREIINNYVIANFKPEDRGWEYYDSNDFRLQLLPVNDYNTFVKYHNEAIFASKEAIRLEEPLKKLGELCAKLKPMAATLNERLSKYESIYSKGLLALDDCKLEEVNSCINQLQSLENSECGHFFPRPYGKTASQELSAKLFDAKKSGKCVEVVPPGAYVLTRTDITTSNDWIKFDEKSLQSFESDDKNNKFPSTSFNLLTPVPTTLIPGKSIKIDISGTCQNEKTSFTYHPYLYFKGDNVGYNYGYDSGTTKTSVGRDPIDKHFIASAKGTMEVAVPADAGKEIILCLRVRWSEEGSTYYWVDYYYQKK